MDENTRLALLQARDYLRQGKPEEARPLLVGVLKQDPKNERAWWMLGFVFEEPERRRYAFEQVLQINPNHEKARQKLEALSEQGSQPAAADSENEAAGDRRAAAAQEPPRAKEDRKKGRIHPTLLASIGIGVLLVVAVVVIAVLWYIGAITLPGILPAAPTLDVWATLQAVATVGPYPTMPPGGFGGMAEK